MPVFFFFIKYLNCFIFVFFSNSFFFRLKNSTWKIINNRIYFINHCNKLCSKLYIFFVVDILSQIYGGFNIGLFSIEQKYKRNYNVMQVGGWAIYRVTYAVTYIVHLNVSFVYNSVFL